MRPAPEIAAEHAVLTTSVGQTLLAEVTAHPAPGPADLARWRKAAPAVWVAAALRLVAARRKGAAKFSRSDLLWLDPIGVEQATAAPVARHKAARFAGAGVVVDLCCGVGGDAVALAGAARNVLAVDADAGMCRRVSWNAAAAGVAERVLAVRGRAERFPRPIEALIHIDPDRRAGSGSRARTVCDYVPGLPFLRALMTTAPGGAIKLGPASDFETHFASSDVEIELVSLDGECKEATVWFGRLADVRRRASCLPAGASWTDRDGSLSAPPRIIPVAAWVFEPDPALGARACSTASRRYTVWDGWRRASTG